MPERPRSGKQRPFNDPSVAPDEGSNNSDIGAMEKQTLAPTNSAPVANKENSVLNPDEFGAGDQVQVAYDLRDSGGQPVSGNSGPLTAR